jgi:hypothetical protein
MLDSVNNVDGGERVLDRNANFRQYPPRQTTDRISRLLTVGVVDP